MENASKALIIAGAILLSILIIGLGMLIFNQAKDAIGNTGMDKQKISAYNSEFESYMGDNINGTKVRNLCDVVRNHNIANQDDESLKIKINDKDDATEINSSVKAGIKAGKTYKVTCTYDSKTGYIDTIKIAENT